MKKILVSDYDNTFYINDNQIYENIEAIKKFQENGNIFVLSTSRSWKSTKKEIDKYNIQFDYLCCNTGGSIFNNSGNLLYVGKISDEIINKVEHLLSETNLKDAVVTRYGIYGEYKERISNLLGYKIKGNKQEIEDLKSNLECILNTDFKIILKNEEKYSKLFLNYKLNSKENSIEKLIEFLPKDNYEIITIGDDDVDFNMLKKYDGYRMENSSDLLTKNITKKVSSVAKLINIAFN